jgi:hypothetical protein
MLEQALIYLRAGLQPIPLKPDKRPLGNWKELQTILLTESQLRERFNKYSQTGQLEAIGIIAGKVSGCLEVIDVDCKYDLTKTLYPDLRRLIDDNLPELANSLPIAKTKNDGYHIYYRCSVIVGNQKLARRPATPTEFEKGDRILDLVETRGEGGYLVAPPTIGYELIQGSFDSVPMITPEERNILLSIGRSFNEEPEQPETTPRQSYQPRAGSDSGSTSPFAHYNQSGDVVALLERHGWSIAFQAGQRTHLKRPGDTDTKTSGNFHEGLRKLYVFSSSTVFEPEKAYSPSDAFLLLECNNDKSEAARRLLIDGYGTPGPTRQRTHRVETSHIRVEASDSNGEETPLTTEDILTEESVKSAVMDSAYIYYTDSSPKLEIFEALALIERTSPVRVYLVELADLANTSEPLKKYSPSEFKAQDIIDRFAEVYSANGEYMDPERRDQFIDEFIATRQTLTDPLEIGRFRFLWLQFSEANELGITQEIIDAVEEKLRVNKERDQRNQALTDLLAKAEDLRSQGKISEAAKVLVEKAKKINDPDRSEIFNVLTTPIKESDIAEQLKVKPTDIQTGFYLGTGPEDEKEEREIRLPAGAISIIAGATSHGKTAFLLNFAVNAASQPLGKNIYVLGYEESGADMIIRAMNAYINTDFGKNNRRIIASYYRGEDYFKHGRKPTFEEKKQAFFSELIADGRLSIQSVDYDSDTLVDAIRHLHKIGNTGGVFIDYMQLLRKPDWKNSRQEELKQICLDLKDVARETGLPIVLAAQFNRAVVNPARMHPVNIGEAGDIERVANVILGLWNNEKRSLCSEADIEELNGPDRNYNGAKGLVYVDLLKNRGGRPNLDGMLNFNGNTGVLSNYGNSLSHTSSNPFA